MFRFPEFYALCVRVHVFICSSMLFVCLFWLVFSVIRLSVPSTFFHFLSIGSVATQELHVLCKASSGSMFPVPRLHRGNPTSQAIFFDFSRCNTAVLLNVSSHNRAVIFVSWRQKYEPVNVKVTWTRKSTGREQPWLCRASLLGTPRPGPADGAAPERQLYGHSWRDGSGGPAGNGQGQWSFPALEHVPCPSASLMRRKARAEWDLRRSLEKAKPWRA